ncbi:MAG: sterol desaturase family protein [Gammaproteobacteria bacterium]|nr:sterol desaturase family protein [Gammaproteobacteria bacterium]MBQ0840354.1 sterol desaturase family protein [Gammaproteobacteria bacterium]
MNELLLGNEVPIRLGFFMAIFALMAGWEVFAPRRTGQLKRRLRWPSNLAIVALNTLLLRVIMPTTAVGLALAGEAAGWGLLQQFEWPLWAASLLAIICLDLAIYLQHIMFHAVPLLWRLHRMHHADLAFDVTTGARFHPFEIILSMLIKLTVIAALGPPAVAVLIFEVLLNALAMFNHANARLPIGLDKWLRRAIVTPDMHRVHHSVIPREANSNFGFNLSIWDRAFGTYCAQPTGGHQEMSIGISAFRTERELILDSMLVQPFKSSVDTYSINKAH